MYTKTVEMDLNTLVIGLTLLLILILCSGENRKCIWFLTGIFLHVVLFKVMPFILSGKAVYKVCYRDFT